MKPGFHPRLLNGYFEDPCVYVRIPWERRALQFDIGDIRRLSTSEMYRITDVFVTHTHIDHFIGFDTLLRTVLRREEPLNIYGPRNVTTCVEGKLKGYAWNLIKDYPTIINVFAYDGKALSHTVFRAEHSFRKEVVRKSASDGLLLRDPRFRVRAAKLDHDIPCLAYSLEEGFHINIDKDLLLKKGLSVGPWLTEFKKMLRERPGTGRLLNINGKAYPLDDLSDIARITKGQKISYATDMAITPKNMSELVRLAKDADLFYCEAYFLEKDRERALERFHLTAKTCGAIARKAGVKKLALMHFSPKYSDCPELVIKEAMEAFKG
jgi:ribonuclease Z